MCRKICIYIYMQIFWFTQCNRLSPNCRDVFRTFVTVRNSVSLVSGVICVCRSEVMFI